MNVTNSSSILSYLGVGTSLELRNTSVIHQPFVPGRACVSHERFRHCSSRESSVLELPVFLEGIHDLYFAHSNGSTEGPKHFFFESSGRTSALSRPIVIRHPPFGHITHSHLNVSLDVHEDQYSQVAFDAVGLIATSIPSREVVAGPITASHIDPGSWFYTVTPANVGEAAGVPTPGYIEFVLPPEEIQQRRRWFPRPPEAPPPPPSRSPVVTTHTPKTICIWTHLKMDGQKKIWLQQSQHLDRSRFRFVWGLGLPHGEHLNDSSSSLSEGIYPPLMKLSGIRVVESPFYSLSIQEDDLFELPSDGSPSAYEVITDDLMSLYRYIHQRLEAAGYVLSAVTPAWCQRFYRDMLAVLQRERCDVSVYGNSRGFSTNVFVTDTARLLGIPAVAELNNLFVDVDIVPTAIVAPSTFAAEHDSIGRFMSELSAHRPGAKQPSMAVIPPSIDTAVFDPERVRRSNDHHRHACSRPGLQPGADRYPCFSVGYLARLAPEKSPGLFVQAAYELLQLHPFARFTMVGGGVLLPSLQRLVARLDIGWAVTFAGWVDEDLPLLLSGLDAVVNPSLWPETFCISNIETMSMGVPLITFGVGGIGEYVSAPTAASRALSNSSLFTVTPNAVLVNEATPEAIALATHFLVVNREVALSIGAAGRRTIVEGFGLQRQMDRYDRLYEQL